ncbi:cupin domain-containing protein [Neisseria animalis]|uniref:AraC family transcriptional regulator n=1 Tax=Neisseria animalis TaxID=492 RepID=A0A5P3MSD4_NEIAN|nr:AraC family transcriptional regulator [Neisseria animalis]QEY24512.1 AraC family transcriptional regulator [Neisseria animalis]ROW33070.1 AraC family transcriptional regulator [Neisseria animalis]VEE07232.1 AraC family transcription regulator [Neisseria animalis]
MDILDRLVQFAQIRGSIDVQCVFREKWYVRHESEQNCGLVHIVTSGSGYIHIDGEDSARLMKAGDVIFFPRTAAHTLSSRPDCDNAADRPAVSHNGVFQLKQNGSSGAPDVSFFCARFEYTEHADIMNNLPEMVLLNLSHPSLQCLAAMLQYESEQPQYGSAAVVNALSAILLVLLVRTYLDGSGKTALSGILKGWHDRRLQHLIQEVVKHPERQWNVGQMSETAHLSRAQLMRLFKQQTGISPHAFVNYIRLQQAALLLKQSAESVLSIALKVGFQSETHFGKAFKKQFGTSPGQYRKTQEKQENTGGNPHNAADGYAGSEPMEPAYHI